MSVHRTGWAPTHHTRKIALVIYPFTARAQYELSLTLGAQMEIVEQNSGWFRGFEYTKPAEKGIFPASYVHVIDSTTIQEGEAKHIIAQGDQLPWELIGILREWKDHLHTEYIKHIFTGSKGSKQPEDLIEIISNNMFELISQRRKFIQGAYSTDELRDFKLKMTEKIDWTNWKLGLDLLPKSEDGDFLQINNTSSIQLFKTHLRINDNVSQRIRTRTGTVNSRDNTLRSVLTPNHIYVVLKQYSCFVKEDSEILISLYNHQSAKFISEYYYSEMGKHGLGFHGSDLIPVKISPMLFMDVGPLELLKDLYLVVRIVRRGRMLEKSGRQVSNISFACRRPFGNGVLPLDNILKAKRTEQNSFLEDLERTYEIVIHLPTNKDNELLFASMHEDLIKKHLKKERDLNSPSLVPGVINHSVRISLKSLEGDLSKLLETFPHLLTKEVAYVPKLGFPEVILPGLVRNHMYVSLLRGEFEKGNKKSARNVEISVTVLDGKGELIEKAIQYGEGEEASNHCSSIIYYHTNTPRFDEIFRVNIPMLNNIFKHSHLRFVFRHVRSYEQTKNAKKDLDRPFAYGFLRLTNQDDTMIKDDMWTIYLYRVDDEKWSQAFSYLALPSYRGEPHKSNPYPKDQPNTKLSPNENFIVQTMTVSTNLTQTVSVMSFLKWREKRKDLTELLKNLCLVSGQEIIKFMRDIFDNLFIILIEPETTENIQGLVFNAIVKILHLLTDKKYNQFKTVLDEYIESHFSASSVHRILLEDFSKKSSFQNIVEGQEFTTMETIWHTMSALEYLFKFIVQSQKLQIRIAPKKQYGHKLYIENALNSLHLMMGLAEGPQRPGIIKGQAEALKNFCSVFPVLLDVKDATKRDIAEWAANFVDSYVDRSTNISQNIIYEARLIFIENILKSSIQIMLDSDRLQKAVKTNIKFVERIIPITNGDIIDSSEKPKTFEARNVLLPVITRILSLHLMNQLCIKRTIEVVASLVHCLQSKTFPLTDRDITQTVVELLAPTMEFCNSFDHHAVAANLETAGTNLANLLGLLDIMQAQHYEEWLKQFVNMLSSCFKLFLMLVKNEIYPRDWTFMYLTQNRVILKAIMYMSMQLRYKTHRYFDEMLWKDYFDLATRFITHRSLQLENYGEIKRLKFLNMYGDMRIVMARDILTKWSILGEYQKFFIPYILHAFLEISLVKERNLRKMIIPVFYNIMKTMYDATDTLQTIEEEIMDKLDELVSEGRGDEEYTNIFSETLTELCNTETNYDFSCNSLSLVNKITKLLERLVDFRNIQSGDEQRNQRLSCIVNLMNFYKEIDHLNVYIRYIHKLFDIHEDAQNYCEAANALLLYSDMLEWTDAVLPPMENVYQSEKERDRKEFILKRAIEYFDRGKTWEMGIILCKELGKQYEEETFEYFKLSEILQTQAKFYVKIIQELRFPRAYFKAGFFGRGYPLFLRNKSFIYQGNEYEKLNDFMSKMQEEFPSAQLMPTTNFPDDLLLNSEGMHLQIYTVEPIPQEFFLFKGKQVPEKVAEYYKGNSVMNFIYNKAYHVGKKDKDNEFASMWIERTNFNTREEFPGILKWSEVVSYSKINISPLENALQTVDFKNKEIYSLINKYKEDTNLNINPLSMALNGVIDAAVMGGISNYQKAFFNDNYLIEHPEHNDFVQQLNILIVDQIEVLREGLLLHSQRVSEDLKPFHEKMETCFTKLERDVFGKREPTPPFNLDVEKTIGTHPIPGMSDDPSGFTQSLFISTDIRTSREFADVEGLDGRLSPGFGTHLSPPSSPHDKRSPKKKLGVVMNIKSLGGKGNRLKAKPKIRAHQTMYVTDPPAIPKKQNTLGSHHSSTFDSQDPSSIINLPLPPIPNSFSNVSSSRSSEAILTEYDYEYISPETSKQILRKTSPRVVSSEIKSVAWHNRNSKTSLQSDDTNQSNTSSTDLDAIADDRIPQDSRDYFMLNEMQTLPPMVPTPFQPHSNGPQPPIRRNVPPPPVPKKQVTKSLSNENVNKLDLSQSLTSESPPITQRNSRAYSIAVVDTRYFESPPTSTSDTSLPEIPQHSSVQNAIKPSERRSSLLKQRKTSSGTNSLSTPPTVPPRKESPSDPNLIQLQSPPPIPLKEPPPVPQRPRRFP